MYPITDLFARDAAGAYGDGEDVDDVDDVGNDDDDVAGARRVCPPLSAAFAGIGGNIISIVIRVAIASVIFGIGNGGGACKPENFGAQRGVGQFCCDAEIGNSQGPKFCKFEQLTRPSVICSVEVVQVRIWVPMLVLRMLW